MFYFKTRKKDINYKNIHFFVTKKSKRLVIQKGFSEKLAYACKNLFYLISRKTYKDFVV